MKRFNEMGIKSTLQNFIGDKVKIHRILNREITVHDYKIEPSKFGDATRCLYLQIELEGTKHIIFTGSVALITMIEQVPKANFPFLTTIIQDDQRYEFT